ncbi:MAG: bifunctional chorismate mutase/prephenate dehydrogenase [Deltaproteobacteria bacterium]|nr:bifunctional chorismate mutase/prephenate dehydrogenase [Deltaproteobacteria bacterium]
MSESLDQLRDQLRRVDAKLLELMAERQRLSGEIGAVKRSAGRPTRDYQQEREVIKRARKAGEDLGLSGDVAEQLMLMLIRSSLTLQEQAHVAAEGSGSGKRVLVIGGSGKMGRWLVRFLDSQGYTVEVADPAGELEGHRSVASYRDIELDHDIIVVAAPLKISAEILEELAADPPPGLIFDVGSLKTPLRAGLAKLAAAGAKVASVHPMFGPDTELLSGRHVIFVDVGNPDAVAEARELFTSTMALQVDMDLENHDRLIAYVLGLAHAVNIAFFTALAESGEAAAALAKLSSTTFDAQLSVASRVASENPGLYFEIQYLNDYGTESLTALLYAVERLRSVVRAGDQNEFKHLMERGLSYLQARPGGEDAPP